jgi:hypothetical protein
MEQHQHGSTIDQVFVDVHAIIVTLEQADETTWSSRIAHTLTGPTVEDVYPLLRHELCGLRRTPASATLGLAERLDALVATLNDALAPYGYRPERCGAGLKAATAEVPTADTATVTAG